jgi:hypothetical protein
MKSSFAKISLVSGLALGIAAVGVMNFAPGLALLIFELFSQLGLWVSGGLGVFLGTVLLSGDDSSNLATIFGVSGSLALAMLFLFTVPTTDFDFGRDQVKVVNTQSAFPIANPNSIRDMPLSAVSPIFVRSPEAVPPILSESEPIPAFTDDGRRLWVIQQYPNRIGGLVDPKIDHYLVEEDPKSDQKGKLTKLFTTNHTLKNGFYGSDTRYLLQKSRPFSKFEYADAKYIQLKDGWKLAIPFRDIKWKGLQNKFIDSGVVLIDGNNIEYVSNTEKRAELNAFPIISSDQVDLLVRGFNYTRVNSFFDLFISDTNEVEEANLTKFSNRTNNFQVSADPSQSGFVVPFEPLGSSTTLSNQIRIQGFNPAPVAVYKMDGNFSPDNLVTKVDGEIVQKYNLVFGANAAASFTRSDWAQVQIGGKSWMVAFLVNNVDPELYKGVIAFHTQQAKVDLDNPNEFVFIKADSNGTMGDKLTQFMSGKAVQSDLYTPGGVQINNPNQATPQQNLSNTELLRQLQIVQEQQKEILQILRDSKKTK